jgi:hypothetical protein
MDFITHIRFSTLCLFYFLELPDSLVYLHCEVRFRNYLTLWSGSKKLHKMKQGLVSKLFQMTTTKVPVPNNQLYKKE